MLPPCENYDECRSYGVFKDGYEEKAFCPKCYAQRKGINIFGNKSNSKTAVPSSMSAVRKRLHKRSGSRQVSQTQPRLGGVHGT